MTTQTLPRTRPGSSDAGAATRYLESADGTRIAYAVHGAGPAVVLVDGELGSRVFGPLDPLARCLASRFAVHVYDRRGRHESSDARRYHVDRETEDLAGVVAAAGGQACVYGASSGAVLLLRSLAAIPGISRAAVFEPPVVVKGPGLRRDYPTRLAAAVAAGRADLALDLFLTEVVGLPAPILAALRGTPAWPLMKAAAASLRYDAAVMGASVHGDLDEALVTALSAAEVPVLVATGGASPVMFTAGADAIAAHLARPVRRVLAGQTHDADPAVVAAVLTDWFAR